MVTLSTQRVLPAPPSAVFECFRDPALLARWWGPDGFTNRFERFVFAPAGEWVLDMIGPDGTVYPNRSHFVAVVPDQRVVIRHESPPHFTLTITLEPAGSGTRIAWAQAFDDDAVGEALRSMCEPANEQNLDRLAAVLSDSIAQDG